MSPSWPLCREILAKIYSLYGGKLLEQNVRVFLQARTKVNKGLIETISQQPDHFFAYNNGLTVTAKKRNRGKKRFKGSQKS